MFVVPKQFLFGAEIPTKIITKETPYKKECFVASNLVTLTIALCN